METSEPGEIQEDAPPSRRSLQQLGGSLDHKVNGFLVGQALNTLWFDNDDPQQRVDEVLPGRNGCRFPRETE
jgi:hypothetical protein